MSKCKDGVLVRGKVPRGPINHQLCITHGHVVDANTREIIAKSVSAYSNPNLQAGPGAKHKT